MSSACVLIECPVTKMILGVSRKDDPNAWGLPGGKVEPGEDERRAACRELAEETGLWVLCGELQEVFRRDGGVTYRSRNNWRFEHTMKRPGETGRVAWITPAMLIAGPFGEYNKLLLQTIGRLPPPVDWSATVANMSFEEYLIHEKSFRQLENEARPYQEEVERSVHEARGLLQKDVPSLQDLFVALRCLEVAEDCQRQVEDIFHPRMFFGSEGRQ